MRDGLVEHVRDGLATAGGLLREAWWLGAEHILRRPIPPRTAAVGPAWVTAVLQPRFPGVRVRSVERIDHHAGTTDRARFKVTYEARGGDPKPPPTLFVKAAPTDAKTRLFVNLMRLGTTEARFYRQLAPRVPVETPAVFHAEARGRSQRFVLVLEDLAACGVRFADVTRPMALDDARLVVRVLARLHACFWDSPRLHDELAWLVPHGAGRSYRVERFLSAASVPAALRRFPDLVPPALRAMAPRLVAARDRLEDAWARGPLTVIHGDAHAGNLFFRAGTAGFFDWQVVQCGQGMRDVSYFLVSSLPTALRRAHEHDLIAFYRSTLAEHGVAAPDAAETWTQYRLHAVYMWIAAAVTAAATTLQAEPIARTGLARSSAALVDLDALAALGSGPRPVL